MSEQPVGSRSNSRRLLAIGVIVLAVIVGAWAATSVLRGEPVTMVGEPAVVTVTAPAGWSIAPADGIWLYGERGRDFDLEGFVLSTGNVEDLPNGWALDPEPPDGGALVSVTGGYIGLDGSTLPGWPLDFDLDDRPPPIPGAADYLAFDHRGFDWEIITWHGEDLDADFEADIEAVVASIGFPQLIDPPEGTAVFDRGVLSIGPGARYPIGSVTPVTVADRGNGSFDLLVVSAPSGPYAVDMKMSQDCELAWDDADRAFTCGTERWDIRGKPLSPGSGWITSMHEGGLDPDGRLWLTPLGSGGRPIDVASHWEEPVR